MKSICALIVAAVFAVPSAIAVVHSGSPAPPLQLTHLLQAPTGALADWKTLRGKIVVLEFWATWCEVCVAELPEFNSLVASLDPSKFQFISVDDEEPEVVQAFLKKRKIAGWVGIDTTGEVFRRFGIGPRPTTVIVNANGKVMAATHPESLTVAALTDLAEGKDVKFSPIEQAYPAGPAQANAARPPLYQISLTMAVADGKLPSMSTGSGSMDLYNWSAEDLISMAYNQIPRDRLISSSPLPKGVFDLHAAWASGEDNGPLIGPFLQNAMTFGLSLHIEQKTVMRRAYVLKKTVSSDKLLVPTAMTNNSNMHGYRNGKVRLINGSMDDLAGAIEGGLDVPVINETGIGGRFDAELKFPAKDAVAARAAILRTLGLELREEERSITVLDIRKRKGASQSATSAAN